MTNDVHLVYACVKHIMSYDVMLVNFKGSGMKKRGGGNEEREKPMEIIFTFSPLFSAACSCSTSHCSCPPGSVELINNQL